MKEILPIIMKGTNDNTIFFDCFMGGANIISCIPSKYKIGIEINKYVWSLWDNIQKQGLEKLKLPKNSFELTKELYDDIKQSYLNNNGKYADYIIGFVGSSCSYGGAWFNGYARYNTNKKEDHIQEAYNGLKKQVENFYALDKAIFGCFSYEKLNTKHSDNITHIPSNAVLICDPPYFGTKQYESDFNHLKFWDWVRKLSKEGIKVYVTEYSAPSDFKCIWKAYKKDGMGTTKHNHKQKEKIEKLFIYSGFKK